MSSTRDLYPSSSHNISLRDEFLSLETGTTNESLHLRPILFRLMRRDEDGKLIPCECVSGITREPDKDIYCPICMGEGWKWDERWGRAYRLLQQPKEVQKPGGLINVPIIIFYADYAAPLTVDDKIVEVELDLEGKVKQPAHRSHLYRIQHSEVLRLDGARAEYTKLWTYQEDTKRLK